MELASKFVVKAIDVVWDPTIRQVGYIIYYRENVSQLKEALEDLGRKRDRVEHEVGKDESNLRIIESDVEDWLKRVQETIKKTEEFEKDEDHTRTRCSSGLLPYLRNRHRLGRKAKKMTADVKLLTEKSKFDGVSHQQNPTSMDAALSNTGYVEFGSRKETMEEIMAKLKDSTVRMIGVYGPSGVGKSTLIKEIARKARDEKLFDVVVMVEVTNNPNLQKTQEEIAYVLELRLEGEVETVRADRLRRRLKKEKENILVILDDLWDIKDLKRIGIPFDDDNDDDLSHMTIRDMKDKIGIPSGGDNNDDLSHKDPNFKMAKKEKSLGDYKGCKILLTSRDKKVLSDKMNDKSIIRVKDLDVKDALMLFKKVAESPDEKSEFKQEIVKYCAGLPMAIVAVGRALRNSDESVREATLEKLKKGGLTRAQKSMEISLKVSYDHLESEELKSIFLLCAQMGHQQLIVDLVKYCFGLGILEGVYTLKEARDRIYTSLQTLKDLNLLSDGNSSDRFNMHDMVRDVALSIAHKEQHVFALRNGKLDDWPDRDELKRCTAISIRNSDIIHDLPEVINCPQLKFFQIDSDDPSLKIPDDFFKGMEGLKVLILTGFHLQSLPSSIERLLNLRMLCLERCILVDNLSIIGALKKLTILSFSGSQIKNLPAKLGCLDKLQLFDISDCSIKVVVPPNLISRLTCLEELYIRNSLTKMKVEGDTNQSQDSFLSQLKHLHQLRTVDLCIPNAAVLPRDLFFDWLNDYKIVIGDIKMLSVGDFRMPNKYEPLRSLAVELTDGTSIHSQKGIKLLFRRVENLLLGELNGVQNSLFELNLDGFPDLKHLSLINTGIVYIIDSMELSHPESAFPNLESLCLYKLRNIKMICHTPVTGASFNKLKTIKVKMCTQLKNLFSFYMVKFLASLETIDVSDCDSLKVIAIMEGQANSHKVEFHKLRSLTLQSLSSFTSFYTNVEMPSVEGQTTNEDHMEITIAKDERSVMVPLSLFGELVEIPNLESLKLSSINNHKIWSDQPLSSSCFQNLIKLTVTNCDNLRYLCSLSVASNLKKLKGLFISDCEMMEKIFSTEGNNVDKVCCIFPKLEEIRLTNLNMLTDIWHVEVGGDSFSSLISVHIEWCHKLDKIFPSHMVGWFGSLDSLKVVDCKSVEVIFEIKDSLQIDTKLQLIHLKRLRNLKQVWDRDPGGILSFKNLRSIEVIGCYELSYVLPASVAKDLKRLERISVVHCDAMEEIVASEDGLETPVEFPEVIFVELCELSKIKRFYRGGHTIECPKLKQLVVYDNCDELATFTTETTNEERQPGVFLAEKVISNLEIMRIGSEEATRLRRNYGKYRMHNVKELTLESLGSIELVYWCLHRMPNLERLNLNQGVLKELVPSRNIALQDTLETVLQLKALTLFFSYIKDLGFERDPVLQRLEHLALYACRNMIKLAPSSVSLTHLTYLEVNGCSSLINIMASSTAKSMAQLATLKVIFCDKVKEIVTNEGNEEDRVTEVVYSKLVSLELVRLQNLTGFYSYYNCEFKFPSLERLIVRECPKLQTFTASRATAPKLQNILVDQGEDEEKGYWEGDLNATIQKVFKDKLSFEYTERLYLSNYPELLEQVWHRNHLVQQNNFRNLKTLGIRRCNELVHAIPSHLLPCFENLEELSVWNCEAVEVIFNINDMRVTKALGTFRRLKKLSLNNLPELEHVWDKDPEGIFGLQELQEMSVLFCDTLKHLFPASVAKDLTRLEVLTVAYCKELVEIFSRDETAAEGATKELVFPCLTSLDLLALPELKYFYPGLHKLEWPVLTGLRAGGCNLGILKYRQDHPEEKALVPMEKIPSLEILPFGIGDTVVTWNQRHGELHLDKLQHFQEESDGVLYKFLVELPNIQKLILFRGLLKEMFYAELNLDYIRVLSHLKELVLIDLDNLNSIGLEHSWLQLITENLQTLKVKRCGRLINLAPHMISFSNLTYLDVYGCKRLLYLLTSSTAKTLCQLKEMKIRRCASMQEIVCTEGDELHETEKIIFEQLHTLYLNDLPQLKCFYPGNFTLCFPSLEKVSVIKCKWMKTFCPVNIIDPIKLSSGVTFIEDATPRWEDGLNSTVRKRFEEEISESAASTSDLRLRDDPLQEIWRGSLPVPDRCFSKLKILVVDGCQFLSEVLPSNLIPFLTTLKELEVRNCSFVRTIFDVKCITEDRKMATMGPALLTFSLEILKLEQLPNLECVWNEDPHGILSIQLLKEVYVDKCKCLTSLFPASIAKDLVKLENLHVKHCEELMVIVEEDNADPKGTDLELMFPCVISLTLLELPKLKKFYRSLHCDMLKISTHPEPHAEGEVIYIEKLTPNLQHLSVSLGDKELKMIWQGNLLHKLKVLVLLCFKSKSDVFPYKFLQQIPNIEKLEVIYGSFKEIFYCERPDVVCKELLSQLKVLRLESLSELISIGLEHSWIEPFIRNLETLEVIRCARLRNLVASPVCFSNLMLLVVFKCHGLVNLFTSSTAKSLARLKKMKIICCKSMQEIVSTEGDESHEDEKIMFEQLQTLYLKDLQELKCFYSGNFTLCFPSLVKVFVADCHKMKTFCPGTANAYQLSKVRLEIDLNSAIRKAICEENLLDNDSNNEEGSTDDEEETDNDEEEVDEEDD